MNSIFMNTMANMNWTQVQRAAEDDALVLLPLGVIEEHGPHLCLGTDIYIAHLQCLAVQKAMAERGYTSVIAPPFYWGVCQANAGFVGSFSARRETVKAVLLDLLISLSEFGFQRVYGINAHGDIEHSAAILEAFREANEKLPIHACYGFAQERLAPFGLTGEEPFLFVVSPRESLNKAWHMSCLVFCHSASLSSVAYTLRYKLLPLPCGLVKSTAQSICHI